MSKTAATVQKVVSTKLPHGSTVFSMIQPTGLFHLGNYFGAVRVWKQLANPSNSHSHLMFGVADLHSITLPQDPLKLNDSIETSIASLIACGLDPEHCNLFVQSRIPQHVQLNWILSCITPMGQLNRMTQFKSKAGLKSEDIGSAKLGLFTYPVLQAADILIYKSTHVPVGQDQAQHLELTRDIAQLFNNTVGHEYFPLPSTMLAPTQKIVSLKNPSRKMSKSDPDELSKIFFNESSKNIVHKINKAVTDSIEGPLYYSEEERPGISNLISLISAVTGQSIENIEHQISDFTKAQLKDYASSLIINELREPSYRYKQIKDDHALLEKIAIEGSRIASEKAQKTIDEVYSLVGLRR
ncbi:BA75_02131T0 [Komagataella pastoris]|uniref:Tryptophan--tRNA ligase, mitochondrial n=1 Tax=Komagataella pastoris TaxID=4922 RepID=A0A1B2JC82_PICPA|nr:BA75_02131T0 [Komagataella pastoris]